MKHLLTITILLVGILQAQWATGIWSNLGGLDQQARDSATHALEVARDSAGAPYDSASVAGNAHALQTKDTTALFNAKTLQGKDTLGIWRHAGMDSAGSVYSHGLTLKGTTANDLPTYGAELLTTDGWGVGTGWTESPNDVFAHTPGNTAALTHSVTITNGYKYQLSWAMSATPAGACTVSLGGQKWKMNDVSYITTWGPTATSTAAFTITPTTDFDGTISLMSLKQITAVSTPVVTLKSSSDTVAVEVRESRRYLAALGDCWSTFMGRNAGGYNTSGTHNTAYGGNAFANNTSGYSNSAFGNAALRFNTVGGNNSAFGMYTLQANTTGRTNTAIGNEAMYYNTTGNGNSANGCQAMLLNTTGSWNWASGYAAGFSNTTGSYNSQGGWIALDFNDGGSYNTALGAASGAYLPDGTTLNTRSERSVYLGANTRAAAVGDTNEIVIGANAIGAGKNTVVIGDTLITLTILRGMVRFAGSQQGRIDSMGYTAVDTSNIIFYFGGKSFTVPETP